MILTIPWSVCSDSVGSGDDDPLVSTVHVGQVHNGMC